jgi:hypothetical protein
MAGRQQITIAAFLNMFVAWESFLESMLIELMMGAATINGRVPVLYVNPASENHARQLVVGIKTFFDYANHDNLIKIAKLYFDQGYPIAPIISAIYADLRDLRTMRNASAHISSSTQSALYGLSARILPGRPAVADLYGLLTSMHPLSSPNDTVFSFYKEKLLTAAEMIVIG